jgi:hypothetical protein
MGLLLAIPLTGCELDDRNSTSDQGYTNDTFNAESHAPRNVSDNFNITFPQSFGHADYRTTMTGVGIKKEVRDYSVFVTTDHPYEQVGVLDVEEDGSWTYSPLYLGGNAKIITIRVNYEDGGSEFDFVTNVF